MKKTGNPIFTFVFGIVFSLSAMAQEASFTASVDKNPVSADDVFTLQLTLENGRGEISPPDLSDFRVVFGPSRSSSYRIINGRQSSTMALSYTLKPLQTGTFTIGSAKANVEGTTLTTDPIKIEVIKGSSSSASSSSSSRSNQSAAVETNENLFLSTQVSRKEAYKGEQIIVTYVLYSRYNNIDLGEIDFPVMDGFWTEDIKDEKAHWEDNLEIINGMRYRKAILKRQVLFPQRSGELTVESASVTARVNRSFFNPGTEMKIKSSPVKISVRPLPGGAPPTFNGAVGTLDYNVSVDRTELEVNEAINFKLTISGRGNLNLIDAPDIEFPGDFEVYDPETTDRISVTANGLSGSRIFQYLIIPRYPGNYEIPEIVFTHFDTRQGEYISSTHGPWEFSVTGEGGGAAITGGARPKTRVEQKGLDIRYIVNNPDALKAKKDQFFKSVGFWIGTSGPFLVLFIFLVYRKRQESLESDVKGLKRRKANAMAKKRLKKAENELKAGHSKEFYAEVFQALYGYLGDKLSIPAGKLSKQVIKSELTRNGIDEEVIEKVISVTETCEMARFAPVRDVNDREFYSKAVELIETLEERIK